MNPITTEMRSAQYDRADEPTQILYRSNGIWLKETSAELGLPEESFVDFANLIGDIILGFIPQNKLIPLLMMHFDVAHAQAEKVSASFSRFLAEETLSTTTAQARLNTPPPIEPSSVYSETDASSEDFQVNTLPEDLAKPRVAEKVFERSVPKPGTKPLTREEILRSLAARRTLQSDSAAARGEDHDA